MWRRRPRCPVRPLLSRKKLIGLSLSSRSDENQRAGAGGLRGEWGTVGLLAIALLVTLVWTGATTRIDNEVYDLGLRLTHQTVRSDIVIVAIDQKSIVEVRQWPWPRRIDAELIRDIAKDRPRALATYLLFLFPSTQIDDLALHEALLMMPSFVPEPAQRGRGAPGTLALRTIPQVRSAVSGTGDADQLPDSDGVVRRSVLVGGGGRTSSSRLMLQMAELDHSTAPQGLKSLTRSIRIPFVGQPGRVATISAASVLEGKIRAGYFNNKYVLIGPTARYLNDHYPTPTALDMPGVEIEANILNALLTDRRIVALTTAEVITLGLGFLVIFLASLLRLAPRANLVFAGGMILLPVAGSLIALVVFGLWIPPFALLITVGLVSLYWGWRRLGAASDYLAEELRGLQTHLRTPSFPVKRLGGRRGDVVLHQMTMLHDARKRISDLRRFVSDILANFPEPIYVVDLEGRITTLNEAGVRLGARVGVFASAGTAVADILATIKPLTKSGDASWPPMTEMLSRSALPPLKGVEPNGRAFELRFTPTLSAEDEPTGCIVHLADITALTEATRQREEALQLLSHDMRSPQAAILATLQHDDFKKVGSRLVHLVSSQARRTLDLADAFVRLAHAETAEFVFEELDFRHVVEESVDAVWSQAQQGKVRLILKPAAEEFLVSGDRSALTRAVVNMIDNAVKFSRPNDSVVCEIRLATFQGLQGVGCHVSDTAGGMSEAVANKVFDRFATVGQASDGTPGIGLGLALVRAVAVRHGGLASCETCLGKGSIFSIIIPLAQATRQPLESGI